MKRFFCLLLCVCLLPAFALADEDAQKGQAVFTLLLNGEIDAVYDQMTQQVKDAVPKATLTALMGQVTGLCGEFKGFGEETVQTAQGLSVHTVLLQMEKQDAIFIVAFDESGSIAGLNLRLAPTKATQAPVSELPETITETEITVDAGTGYPLKGLLTLPKTGDNLPAVVLVHGSGSNDRNEAVGQTKMFEDIAYALAQQGIAVVRYDKRTYVYGATMTAEEINALTVEEETIQDAIAAGQLLAATERVDASKVFVVGHSMGAMLAPRIAAEADGLFAGTILLSGTPYTLAKLIYDQNLAAISALQGEQYAAYKQQLDEQWAAYEALSAMTKEEQQAARVFGVSGYYLATMQENPAEYIRKNALPTLIINGGEDFQITDANGFTAWQEALEGAPESCVLYHAPALNHVLMTYTGAAENRYSISEYDTPAHVDEGILTLISDFIKNTQHGKEL